MRLPSLLRGEPLFQRWLGDDFERFFERFFDELFARRGLALPKAETEIAFLPDVDVIERDNEYLIRAELPGVALEDIEVAMVGDTLQIKGEKKTEKEEKKDKYYFCERSYGSFLRRIPLPTSVDADRIAAKLERGVLEIVAPKSEAVKAKKIEVKGEGKEEVAQKAGEGPRPREERVREKR